MDSFQITNGSLVDTRSWFYFFKVKQSMKLNILPRIFCMYIVSKRNWQNTISDISKLWHIWWHIIWSIYPTKKGFWLANVKVIKGEYTRSITLYRNGFTLSFYAKMKNYLQRLVSKWMALTIRYISDYISLDY